MVGEPVTQSAATGEVPRREYFQRIRREPVRAHRRDYTRNAPFPVRNSHHRNNALSGFTSEMRADAWRRAEYVQR